MWIDAHQIAAILRISVAKAYQIIRNLKNEQMKLGYYTNPNAKVPVAFFCERFGLDQNEVREYINQTKSIASA